MAASYLGTVGAILLPFRQSLSVGAQIAVALVLLPFVVWPQLSNYFKGRDAHAEFKHRYGEPYIEKVESGQIPITPTSVLITRYPGTAERLL